MAFALMNRRRKSAYKAVFRALDEKHVELTGRGLSPVKIVTDFEVRYTSANVLVTSDLEADLGHT
jgi:hypothetical protein